VPSLPCSGGRADHGVSASLDRRRRRIPVAVCWSEEGPPQSDGWYFKITAYSGNITGVPVVAGRVTAIDRVALTHSLGLISFALKPDVSLRGIEVGASVSFVSEEADDGRLVVTDLVRLSF
jgi:hypothetical protein